MKIFKEMSGPLVGRKVVVKVTRGTRYADGKVVRRGDFVRRREEGWHFGDQDCGSNGLPGIGQVVGGSRAGGGVGWVDVVWRSGYANDYPSVGALSL